MTNADTCCENNVVVAAATTADNDRVLIIIILSNVLCVVDLLSFLPYSSIMRMKWSKGSNNKKK
jgi:hypothetical protein